MAADNGTPSGANKGWLKSIAAYGIDNNVYLIQQALA